MTLDSSGIERFCIFNEVSQLDTGFGIEVANLWINAHLAALFIEAGFEKENEDYILGKYFEGNIPAEAREKILCYQILWDYLWAQWTVIKEAKGDDFGTYGRDRYNRAKENLKKIKW